jgi:signal transduction histidine kinase
VSEVSERSEVHDQVVLVVDDEPANQRAVRRALLGECSVLMASSGEEALAILASEQIALVITDQRMPGMSGTDLLAETIRIYPHLVRVVLTGYADVATLVAAINGGHVYHFLSKPWQTRELRQVVRRGLERHCAEMERIRLMEELEVAWGRARLEAQQKGSLLELTAHELGTPLHILVNALELLQETEHDAAASEWIEMAQRASRWLARGVAQMNRSGRVQGESLRLKRETFDVAVLLQGIVADLVDGLQCRKLSVEMTLPEKILVRADPQWIRQAVWGLLSNAVRFTPDGGWIRVEAAKAEDAVAIIVSDSGVGIAADDLEGIFEPFSSAMGDVLSHSSGQFTFGARGLGLGLATVMGIMQAHGGTASATSSLGRGSRFVLQFDGAWGEGRTGQA